MNVGEILKQFVSLIDKIAPLLPVIESILPGFGRKVGEIRDGIESEGAEFIVRNEHVFDALASIGETVTNIGSIMNLIGDTAPKYAADGELTLEEIESLGRMLQIAGREVAKSRGLADDFAALTKIN